MRNKTLSIFARGIIYNKYLKAATRHTNASLLWSQLDFWFDKYPNGFHKKLLEGEMFEYEGQEAIKVESWTEELAFTQDEFYTAFSKLGIRYTSETAFKNAGDDIFQGMLYCSVYYRKTSDKKKLGRTFYYRNHEVADAILDMINLGKIDQVKAYLKEPNADLLLGRQQEFTFDFEQSLTDVQQLIKEKGYQYLGQFSKQPSDKTWSKLKATISNLDEVLDEVEKYCAKNPTYTSKRKDLAAVIRAFAKKTKAYPAGFKEAYAEVFTSKFEEAPILPKVAAAKMESIRDKIRQGMAAFRNKTGDITPITDYDLADAWRILLENIKTFEHNAERWSLPLLDHNYQSYYLKVKQNLSNNGKQKSDNGISLSEDERAVLNGDF